MPGYKLTEEDERKVSENFLCIRCSLVLRKPMQLCCSHHVCASCLEEWRRDQRHQRTSEQGWDVVQSLRCPSDGKDILYDEVFPDNFLRRDIMHLKVKCLEREHGCTWEGHLKTLEQHGRGCLFVKVACECGMSMNRCDHEEHSKNACEARLVPCTYCGTMRRLNQMEVHQSTGCPEFPIACPKCNEPNIIRSKLERHWDPELGNCEEAENHCPFEKFGCEKKEPMKRREWLEHAGSYLKRHLRLVGELLPRLATQGTVDTMYEESQRKFESLSEAVRELQVDAGPDHQQGQAAAGPNPDGDNPATLFRLHERCDLNMNDVVYAVNYCLERLQQQELKMGVLERDGARRDAAVGELEAKVEELDTRQAQFARRNRAMLGATGRRNGDEFSPRVAEIQGFGNQRNAELVGVRPGSLYDGVLLWKIESVARKRTDAVSGRETSLYSPCFYTSRRGYKMRLRIHLDGDGSGKRTHISVFFVVMRGRHDGDLRWPFRQEVTIKLLDQDNANHVTTVFRPDPNSPSFQRPSDRTEMNVASGCPRFCPLQELSEHAYVKYDVMFLKAVVDTSDL